MKSAKFYVSLLLASCFAFASAGCSAKEVRFGPKALADYAEKCDAQQYKDADEWVEDALKDIALKKNQSASHNESLYEEIERY